VLKYAMLAMLGMALTAGLASAQGMAVADGSLEISPGEVQPTPEMWFYIQEMRRYDDPREAVRRKAEFKSAQRQRRLASQKWFGMSTARPIASPTPFTSTYSPYWASNSWDPFSWRGVGHSPIVVRPSPENYTRW